MQDLNREILLHQDIGFGPKYINYERKIEYSTLAKEAIRIKLKNEILSEEMRLLYVALTRSKEKIIITGILPSNGQTQVTPITNNIPISTLKSAKSYLEWLELVSKYNNVSNILKIEYHNKDEIIKEENADLGRPRRRPLQTYKRRTGKK